MEKFAINTVTASNADRAVGTMVLAFGADPAARWLYQDAHQYLVNFPNFVRAFGGAAFDRGSASYVDGFLGTAFWIPPGGHPDEAALLALLDKTASKNERAEVFALFDEMDRAHPKEPHWYLPMIGVEPNQQQKGVGSALLEHGLRRCDQDGKLAYLESTSEASMRLYERYGFVRLGTLQVGTSPPIFPMVRVPQTFTN